MKRAFLVHDQKDDCSVIKSNELTRFWVEFGGGCKDHPGKSPRYNSINYCCRHLVEESYETILTLVAPMLKLDSVVHLFDEAGSALAFIYKHSSGVVRVQSYCHCLPSSEDFK